MPVYCRTHAGVWIPADTATVLGNHQFLRITPADEERKGGIGRNESFGRWHRPPPNSWDIAIRRYHPRNSRGHQCFPIHYPLPRHATSTAPRTSLLTAILLSRNVKSSSWHISLWLTMTKFGVGASAVGSLIPSHQASTTAVGLWARYYRLLRCIILWTLDKHSRKIPDKDLKRARTCWDP